MKIDKLVDNLEKDLKGMTVEEKIYKYITEHPDEVFEYWDEDLLKAFPDVNQNTTDWVLWNLAKEKRIGRIKIGRRVYFGSNEAIEELRKKLPKSEYGNVCF
jgi:hypothetical protein